MTELYCRIFGKISFLLSFLIFSFTSQAKTKHFGTWIDFELEKKITKKIDFSLIPELRLEDNFDVDEYLLEGKLSVEPVKFLSFAAGYRINNNIKKNSNEWTNRFSLDAIGSKEFGRWDPSLRLRFSNYSDFDEETDQKSNFLRYRAKLGYDIKSFKFNPFLSYELFQELNGNGFTKGRFDIGFDRNIGKKSRISLYYRLQDYFSDKNSVNILGIGYRLKF